MISLTWWVTFLTSHLTWRYVLKTSSRYLCKTSWRRPEDALKTFLQDFLTMSWRRLEDVFKTSWKTSWKRFQNVFKTSCKNVFKTSSRRLENVLKTSWRRILKTKTKDIFKTSSRRLHQDECLVEYFFVLSAVNFADILSTYKSPRLNLPIKFLIWLPLSHFTKISYGNSLLISEIVLLFIMKIINTSCWSMSRETKGFLSSLIRGITSP